MRFLSLLRGDSAESEQSSFFIHINFRDQVPDKYMPTEEIIENCFAVFSFCYLDVTTDDGDFDNGLAAAALARGNQGETVSDITRNFPFWFALNYLQYSDHEAAMPFDQHFLLAGCAPRLVYVASAAEDDWADPNSEYLSCCAAGEVYKRLGLRGLVHPDRIPQCGDALHERDIGYHLRASRHYLSREDWNNYNKFLRSKEYLPCCTLLRMRFDR